MKRIRMLKHFHQGPLVPAVREVRLSEGVALVLCDILGLAKNMRSVFNGHVILRGIDRSMENFVPRMELVGLSKHDFLDMVMRLREMSLYAVRTDSDLVFEDFLEGML